MADYDAAALERDLLALCDIPRRRLYWTGRLFELRSTAADRDTITTRIAAEFARLVRERDGWAAQSEANRECGDGLDRELQTALAHVNAVLSALADAGHPAIAGGPAAYVRDLAADRDEANERERRLREALVNAAVPLEALFATECDAAGTAMAPEVKTDILIAVTCIRALLAPPANNATPDEEVR